MLMLEIQSMLSSLVAFKIKHVCNPTLLRRFTIHRNFWVTKSTIQEAMESIWWHLSQIWVCASTVNIQGQVKQVSNLKHHKVPQVKLIMIYWCIRYQRSFRQAIKAGNQIRLKLWPRYQPWISAVWILSRKLIGILNIRR